MSPLRKELLRIAIQSGFSAHPLTYAYRFLKQGIQHPTGNSAFPGLVISLPYLAEDLGLTQNHGFKPGSHPEQVFNSLLTAGHINDLIQVFVVHIQTLGNQVPQSFFAFFQIPGGGVNLDPVAG